MSLRTEKRGSLGHELARRPRFRRKLENYELRLLGNEKLSFELPLGGISYSRNYPVRGLPLEINMNSLSSLPPPPTHSTLPSSPGAGEGRGEETLGSDDRSPVLSILPPSSLLENCRFFSSNALSVTDGTAFRREIFQTFPYLSSFFPTNVWDCLVAFSRLIKLVFVVDRRNGVKFFKKFPFLSSFFPTNAWDCLVGSISFLIKLVYDFFLFVF